MKNITQLYHVGNILNMDIYLLNLKQNEQYFMLNIF